MNRIDELEKILRNASDAYYNRDTNIMTDEEFDTLKDELQKLDPNNKFLKEVGSKTNQRKIKLPFVSGSLNKIKDVTKWIKEYAGPYLISDKLDGTSGIIEIKNKKYNLYKRGDGIYGSDITHLIKYLKLPKITNENNNVVIRGELMISRKDFLKIDMKNARNAVNGLVNSKTINETVAKYAHFIAHSIQYPHMTACDQLSKLVELGYETPYSVVQDDINNLETLLDIRRKISSYDIDGLVVTDCSDIYISNELYPKYSFAFKTINEIVEAQVEDVIWTASKNKYLKPVIIIKPITIGGITITNATAFNGKFIVDNGIGPGAIVEIIRGGDVIPHILNVKKRVSPKLPTIAYKWNDTNVDMIALNDNVESITAKILYFFKTLNIKYIGEGIIIKMVENNYNNVLEILSEDPIVFANIEGIGEKMIKKIFDNIKKKLLNVERYELMAATGIFGRGFGIKKLELILSEYEDIDKYSYNEIIDGVSNIKGFSVTTAKQFAENFQEFKDFENELKKIINVKYNKKKILRNVVFTGFRDEKLKQLAESKGDNVSYTITKNINLVVYVGETTKLKKARDLGIKTIELEKYKKDM